jgi:Ser/Thr protein kinase RdoA (MazF antagonist)
MFESAPNHIDEMDSLIKRATEDVLNTAVAVSAKMTQGQVNYVYKIEAEGHKFIVKAFKRGWPEEGKLSWIERQLTQYEVPHAKMLYYSRGDAFFPHGFTISEYVEGQNALEAIAGGSLSLETYYSQIGALLRRVHQVPAQQYGYIGYGPGGMYPTFTEHKLIHEVRERLLEMLDTDLSDEIVYLRIEEKVRRQLTPFEDRFKPVLIHADPVPKNAVWTTDHQLILIDWDEAIAGAWIADFTQLTYWHRYSNPFSVTVNHEEGSAADAFFRGYGAVEFNAEEMAAMENALHIIHSVDLLPFYLRENNLQAFKQTKERLLLLLEQK